MHENDEQSQVAGRESALIVTSLECHKGVNSPLHKSPAQSEGEGRQTFSTHWKLAQPV